MSTTTAVAINLPSASWINYMHASLDEVFNMMLGVKVTPCEGPEVTAELTAMVGLAGSLCGLFTIRCSSATGSNLAEKMLGTPECEDQVLDALGEICNMLAGSFKSRIPEIADTCMLSVPTTIAGSNYHVHPHSGGQRHETLVKCEDQLLQVILHVNC
ncbi:MAG TPA: chemotaxis protein CheX [Candidatus Angelobacter sp.]|jgi:chemotaxis protein CheX|nr:chemotaxis protein CheX [Candidatus Angelobacter sp.]